MCAVVYVRALFFTCPSTISSPIPNEYLFPDTIFGEKKSSRDGKKHRNVKLHQCRGICDR